MWCVTLWQKLGSVNFFFRCQIALALCHQRYELYIKSHNMRVKHCYNARTSKRILDKNMYIYRISSYSFRGNYSFLNLEIQRSQYINVRKLFKGGNYMRIYVISFCNGLAGKLCTINRWVFYDLLVISKLCLTLVLLST